MNKYFVATLILGFLGATAAFANPGAGPGGGAGPAAAAGGAGTASGTGYRSFSQSGASGEGSQPTNVAASPRPVGHANLIAESEARSRIGAFGYVGITGLNQDNESIWHGQAYMNGDAVNVALDTRGNVVIE